jgi:hypothetical protein
MHLDNHPFCVDSSKGKNSILEPASTVDQGLNFDTLRRGMGRRLNPKRAWIIQIRSKLGAREADGAAGL